MKKKIIAVILSLVMLVSCPLAALAASVETPDFSAVVTAVQADLNDRVTGTSALARLSVSLLRSVTERLKNTEITAEDVKAAADEASVIMAKLYAAMGSYAEKLLNEAKDKLTPAAPDEPAQPQEPSDPSDPSDPSNPSNPTNPDKPEKPDETEKVTFRNLSDELKKYIFIKVENPDEVAELIAESCEFTYTTVNGEDGTVYIRVNIEENPEIFNYGVFRRLVEDLYEQQGEEMLKNEDGETDYLMSYEHIAGELALHALLYAASNELLRVTGISSSRLLKLYRSAAQADLNVDEARLPGEVFSIVGILLMDFFSFHLLSALGLI